MPPLERLPRETTTLRSFDGAVVERAVCARPDRYRQLEADLGRHPRIARGGGYSYAAASFGSGAVVLDLARFDRVLAFDPAHSEIEVEAGMTLGRLLEVTLPAGLWLPVLPGHPGISVGGCIAANVHGKNPSREGTFRRWVRRLTLVHPDHGTLCLEPGAPAFELTCGGYGLTGVIVAATLALEPLQGLEFAIGRRPVASLEDAHSELQGRDSQTSFCYSWHDPVASSRGFGRGIVYEARIVPSARPTRNVMKGLPRLAARRRRALPFPVFGWGTRLATGVHWARERMRGRDGRLSLSEALFPLAHSPEYFQLYGKRGLAEYQVLVPRERTSEFLARLRELVLRERPPAVMLALRLFRGEQRLLRFEGDGLCLTLDLARSARGIAFLERLDELTAAVGALPNLIKDSRLPAAVVRRCYPEYERFSEELRRFDPARLFRSELSMRLGL